MTLQNEDGGKERHFAVVIRVICLILSLFSASAAAAAAALVKYLPICNFPFGRRRRICSSTKEKKL